MPCADATQHGTTEIPAGVPPLRSSASLTYYTSLVYGCGHGVIESVVFTREVGELLTDDEYADLQWHLALYPRAGDAIQDTGGLRKVRWASGGGGK